MAAKHKCDAAWKNHCDQTSSCRVIESPLGANLLSASGIPDPVDFHLRSLRLRRPAPASGPGKAGTGADLEDTEMKVVMEQAGVDSASAAAAAGGHLERQNE